MQNKHILFLTPGFARYESDTACMTYFQNYLHVLRAEYPDVTLTIVSLEYPYQAKEYDWHGIRVHALGGANKRSIAKLKIWWQTIRLVKRIHQKRAITTIHSLWLKECALLGHYLQNRLSIPHICTAMGTDVLATNGYLRLLPLSKMTLIFVSEFQQKALAKSIDESHKRVISWGLTPNAKGVPNWDDRPIDLLNVGFQNELKNIDLFLKSCADLKTKKPNLRAIIVGRIYNQERLREQIKQLQLSGNVTVTDEVPNGQVLEMMLQSKVLVHTSRWESQGYVFLEALRAGMSIASFAVGIAEATETWKIANNDLEFVAITDDLLNSQQDTKSQLPYPILDTVKEYSVLYGLA